MRRSLLAIFALSALALPAHAAVRTETVAYTHGEVKLQGFLAYDDALAGPRPGVIVVHEWWGLNDYAKMRAEKLAREGYVALAIDMYGEGKTTEHPKTAGEWATAVGSNRELAKARFLTGYEQLKKHPRVAGDKVAAIGYCFGGSTVLGMAMAGADLRGVASFHGSLPQDPITAGKPKARMLICHGAADSFISTDQIATFQKNLAAAGADWQFVAYGNARHSFTNPGADKFGIDGLKYDAAADERSWALLLDFLVESFR